jgi:CO dehydrogenase maturation factor
MKIMICGKGGSGKSTISTLLARALSARGYGILLVDGDESNVGLHRLLGGEEPVIFMDSLGGKKGFREKMNSSFPKGNTDVIFAQNTKIDEIPKECITNVDGIRLLAVGKIHDPGEGCACPIGSLSKTILSKLVIDEKEIVIIDAEAGIEHFGRGIDAACDMILGVVDPTFESFMLAKKMEHLARKAGKEISFVMNKVDERVEASMNKNIDQEKVVARIPMNNDIFMDSLEGRKVSTDLPEIEKVCELIETKKKALGKTGPKSLQFL